MAENDLVFVQWEAHISRCERTHLMNTTPVRAGDETDLGRVKQRGKDGDLLFELDIDMSWRGS